MRALIKSVIFSFLSVQACQYVIGAFHYGLEPEKTIFLVVLALAMLSFFLKPLVKLVGLPDSGPVFVFLKMILVLLLLYILTSIIAGFSVVPVELSGLTIFGFELPSKNLTTFWSAVFSSLTISLVYSFFDWLCPKGKK